MRLKSFLLKNKVFSVLTLFFSVWIAILLVLAVIGTREIVFYDALGQIDISVEYSSVLDTSLNRLQLLLSSWNMNLLGFCYF